MKLTQHKITKSNFPFYLRNYIGFLLLFFIVNGEAQIYISENTIFTVSENEVLYSSEGFFESSEKEITKVIAEDLNLADSLIRVVKVKKEKTKPKSKKTKITSVSEKLEENLEGEEIARNEKLLLSFKPVNNRTADCFLSNKISKTLLVRNHLPLKPAQSKQYKEYIVYNYILDLKAQKTYSYFTDHLPESKHILKKFITRPPPFQIKDFLI